MHQNLISPECPPPGKLAVARGTGLDGVTPFTREAATIFAATMGLGASDPIVTNDDPPPPPSPMASIKADRDVWAPQPALRQAGSEKGNHANTSPPTQAFFRRLVGKDASRALLEGRS